MSRDPLDKQQIDKVLADLSGWSLEGNALSRTFEFSNFREAVSFIVRVSFEAEDLNHHPEISNVYNRVGIRLTTHDAGDRVTEMDVKLARAIDQFSWV